MLLIAAVTAVTAVTLIGMKLAAKKTDADNKIKDGRKDRKNYLIWLYRFFKTTPFLSGYFAKVYARVLLLYPADTFSVNMVTTKILAAGSSAGILALLFVFVVGQGDLFYLCSGIFITFILITGIVNKKINKIENTIMTQMSDAISKVRHYYQNTGIVELSISLALDELPYEIGLHFQNIYNVITSSDLKYEVDKYISTSPNKYMTTFLSICSTIKEMGDKKLEDGTSVFITDLNYLKENINDDYMAREKHRMEFSALGGICLVAVIGIKPSQYVVSGMMEETAAYYNGIYGIVTMVLLFILSFACYSIVVTLREKGREVDKADNIFAKLAQLSVIEPFLQKVIKKRYVRYNRYDKNLQATGDHSGPMAFLLKRICFSAVAFAATVLILFSSEVVEKYQQLHSFAESFTDAVVPNEEYRQTMRAVAEENVKAHRYDRSITKEELTQKIMEQTAVSRETYAKKIADLVIARIDKYNRTYFKFWYLLIALAAAAAAYMAPVAMLRIKSKTIKTRKQEEVMQFQNLMLILMHMDGITVAEILEWMERFAYCFKDDIATCRVNLSHGEHEALVDLKMSTDYNPFAEFVDNLIAIDKVGVEEAFDEIKTDRNYYKEQRKLEQEKDTKEKSTVAQILAFVPLLSIIILYLIVPMLIYTYNMYGEMNAIM